MDAFIKAEDLSREYAIKKHSGFLGGVFSAERETIYAVKGMSFSIKEGEVAALVGPNGSGKSTVIKMILGIMPPTSGTLSVMGAAPFKEHRLVALRTGAVFGFRSQLWWDLPLCDSFKLLKKIYRVPDDVFRQNLEYAKEYLDIGNLWNQPVRQLSPGQLVMAKIGAAIQHGPKLLVLDEPTAGIDTVVKRRILEFIKKLCRERSCAVMMSTREMKDAQDACARVILIDGGSIVADSPVEVLMQRYSRKKTIKIDLAAPLAEFSLDGAEGYSRLGGFSWNFEISGEITMGRLIDEISKRAEIVAVTVEEQRIEDIIHDICLSGLEGESAPSRPKGI
jgi:ABC-2 type transport system ATP-binding protein